MNDFELKCQKLTNLIEKYTKNGKGAKKGLKIKPKM